MGLQNNTVKNAKVFLPLFLIGFTVLLYWPTYSELFSVWAEWDHSLSHGFPLAVFFLFIIYRALPWPLLAMTKFERGSLLTLLVMSSIAWLLFYIVKIKILEQFSVVAIIIFSLGSVYSLKTIWSHRLALLLPIYVLPFWDYLNDWLVQLSSFMVGGMVRISGLPAMIDGNSIHIPAGQIIIADGCSGLRYLIISLALAHIISTLNGYKEKGLFTSLALAALLGLVTNWIRIFALIYIGYKTEMRSSLMEDHEMFGWILFGCICLPAIYLSPVISKNAHVLIDSKDSLQISIKHLLVACCALAVGPFLAIFINVLPTGVAREYKPEGEFFEKSFDALLHSAALPKNGSQANYKVHNRPIFLQINHSTPVQDKSQLVPYIDRQFDIEVWRNISTKTNVSDIRRMNVQLFQHKYSGRYIAQVQWFDVGGNVSATIVGAKFNQIPAMLTGKQYFSIVTLQMQCEQENCNQAQLELINASTHIQ